jgi:hypothetical protein
MILNNIFVDKKINDIQIKMLREKEKCYIKIIPLNQKSTQKKIIIKINGEKHQWDIYDKNGRESHKIYLKGQKIEPCFYLINTTNSYRIVCNKKDINIKKLSKENKNKVLQKNIFDCISQDVECWGVKIYMTSRAEKSPFCYM